MIKPPVRKDSSLDDICDAIRTHQRFLLSAHIRPEGDSVGSLLGLKALLSGMGKEAWIVCQDPFPQRLDLMPQDGWHTVAELDRRGQKPKFDACIVVDCPNPSRIGKVQEWIAPDTIVINIDHHVSNVRFGHHNFVNDRAAACGEIVYDLFKKLNVPITKEAALPIYVSISTDTGSFKYSNTTSKTHKIAAELIQTGINLESINENVYERSSRNRVKLLADLLKHMQVEMGGKVVWAVVNSRMIKKTRATLEDTEGFIDFLRSVADVQIAFILIESGKRIYQVSFRAKGSNDVNQIAEVFGGGGHRKAAGCTIYGTAQQAAAKILAAIHIYFRNFANSLAHRTP